MTSSSTLNTPANAGHARMIAEEVFPGRWFESAHGNLNATTDDGQPVGFNISDKGITFWLEDTLPHLAGDVGRHVSSSVNQALRDNREYQQIRLSGHQRFERAVQAVRGLISRNAGRYRKAMEVRLEQIDRYHADLRELNTLLGALGGRQTSDLRDGNGFKLAEITGKLNPRQRGHYTLELSNVSAAQVERLAQVLRNEAITTEGERTTDV